MTEQHVIPESTPGVTQYEFENWDTAKAAQRALLEIDRSVAAAKILYSQMMRKRREISRSMGDLTGGIAYTAGEFRQMAADLEKMAGDK